jgi:hypothetical protein
VAKAGRRKGSKGRGWGVPFPKVSRKPTTFSQAINGPRTDDDLHKLQEEWVLRYKARVRAHRLLGLSMGTPLDEVEERYHRLIARLSPAEPRRLELDAAFQLVQATAESTGSERAGGTEAAGVDEGGRDVSDFAAPLAAPLHPPADAVAEESADAVDPPSASGVGLATSDEDDPPAPLM